MAARDRSFLSLNRYKDRYMRAYQEINEGRLDCFRIFIVLQSRDSVDQVFRYLERHSENFKNEFIQATIGIISEEGEFLPII